MNYDIDRLRFSLKQRRIGGVLPARLGFGEPPLGRQAVIRASVLQSG
jgi:hypothetical protein